MDNLQWNMLVQDVADNFDDVTIKRGFQYYKQGHVEQLLVPSPQQLEAYVRGHEQYHVVMNLDFFSLSDCSCPVDDPCKHMIAALLEYAYRQNRSVTMIVNAKSITASPPVHKFSPHVVSYSKAAQIAGKKTETQTKLKEQATRIATMNVSEWHELFELCTAHIPQNTRSFQYVEDAQAAILRLEPKLPPVIDALYTLNINLFLLSKITKNANTSTNHYFPYHDYYLEKVTSDLQETIVGCFNCGLTSDSITDNEQHIQQTLSYIRMAMLMESKQNRYFLDVYHSYWHYWILPHTNEATPYEDELLVLENARDELHSSLSQYYWLFAQVLMFFYSSKDLEAWALLSSVKAIDTIPPYFALYFLNILSQKEQWNRLIPWLTKLSPHLFSSRGDHLRAYMIYWELATPHVQDAEKQMWDTLKEMLPASGSFYEEKLMEQGKWKQWIDYHISRGSNPLDFRVSELQPIEKNAPEVVLPFYHHAVENYILNKNRDSYKAAVKLLKRLAKLYKKMKHEER